MNKKQMLKRLEEIITEGNDLKLMVKGKEVVVATKDGFSHAFICYNNIKDIKWAIGYHSK
jgi:hypothetical protein